ncbi:DUF4406 domain-containing protein [Ructibacterium gallinarum]|uniref:DUF7768 domain-containing protein n=1 Tax=Ructibacterium gallinarum TaxID=2779355 RepID=A0A9D5R8K9_9FIRM|nr:DUF4406 domain-containing protein [Ructibacterium gallinarum]MBE5040526.1 hypothetical protein [Ructibacterium gallinarum]
MSKELVYVCSPLGAPTKEGVLNNMHKAREYAKTVSEKMDCRAIAPHGILPEYLDDNIPEERAVGLRFGLDLLRICKKMVVCGNVISSGMQKEIELAEKLGIEVRYLKEQHQPRVTITVIEIEGE